MTHSNLFVAMGREKEKRKGVSDIPLKVVWCDRCGGPIYEGDWPFCDGRASTHSRD